MRGSRFTGNGLGGLPTRLYRISALIGHGSLIAPDAERCDHAVVMMAAAARRSRWTRIASAIPAPRSAVMVGTTTRRILATGHPSAAAHLALEAFSRVNNLHLFRHGVEYPQLWTPRQRYFRYPLRGDFGNVWESRRLSRPGEPHRTSDQPLNRSLIHCSPGLEKPEDLRSPLLKP